MYCTCSKMTPSGASVPAAARQSRVTIVTPAAPLPRRRARKGGTTPAPATQRRREQIRLDRRTTAHQPEYMRALRRTRLHLGSNERVREIILRVDEPLPLPPLHAAPEAREALCRRLPWLRRGRQEDDDDDDAYHAACHRPVRLLTTDVSGGSWYCEGIVDPRSRAAAACRVVNDPSRQTCHRCGATRHCRPNLRPFYSRLARLRSAVHQDVRIKFTRIAELDDELDALGEALGLAKERLAQLRRFVADSPQQPRAAGPGGIGSGAVNADDAPESLKLLDIDITQSGSWQRADVRTLVPDIIARQRRTHRLMKEIRGELGVIVQVLYETAAPTVQKVVRGHLLRCRFDSIRRAIVHKAENAAATEVQRTARSWLAKMEAESRRVHRREAMRLRIQTAARRFVACQEYRRRHAAYIRKLRHDMTLRIQRLARMRRAKSVLVALAVEKRRRVAEAERRRDAVAKDSSVIRIQSIARVWLARRTTSQRRIELTLSNRLLHLLEKLKCDGNVHSMLSEINADYRYYDREMKQMVAREDQTASTFIGKVLKERGKEFDEAWRHYRNANAEGGQEKEERLDKEDNVAIDRLHMYNPAPKGSSSSDEHLARFVDLLGDQGSHENWEFDRMEEMNLAGLSHTSSHRFSGTSIVCDIPQLLDDTLARLMNAVAIRSFVSPSMAKSKETESGSPTSTDAFQYYLNLPPGLEKANIEAQARSLAKPIIEQLNRMGFVYISDAMPRANLVGLLESPAVAIPPSSTFISCCKDVLTFLERAHDVNTSTRGSVRALVSEFIESRREITMRVERKSAGGEESDCKGRGTNIGEPNDDDSLPSGLFDETSSHSDQSTEDSDEREELDAPANDSSASVSQPAITKAQHDFEAELDGIVSVAIADTQHRSGACKPESSISSYNEGSSKICTTGGGKRSRFVGFKGGLFRQAEKKKTNCTQSTRPRRSPTTDSSKCWAVPYTESVRQSHPKYVKYRSQKALLDSCTHVDGAFNLAEKQRNFLSTNNMSNLLDGLPDDMKNTLKTMFKKKREDTLPSLLTS